MLCYLPVCVLPAEWQVSYPDIDEPPVPACDKHLPNLVASLARNDPERNFTLNFRRI
jgi:hypothetical protein